MAATVNLATLARRQLADYDAHTPGTAFGRDLSQLTIDDAYRVQLETARLRVDRGEVVAGYKIGCVSETIRRQLRIEHAVFGHLFEGEIRESGCVLAAGEFDHLAIEGEFAVVDGEVFPVIELHNYVLRGGAPPAVELIANNAVHAGVVAGDDRSATAGELEISVEINGESRGFARADPRETLDQLGQRLEAHGIILEPGQMALTGSPLPLFPIASGDRIRVVCPEIGEVTASVE